MSDIFDHARDTVKTPKTEGIKYAGSKLKIIPYIVKIVNEINPKTVFDGFSGTTRVSQALGKLGYKIIANDIAVWSKIFGQCYLLNKRPRNYYKDLISHLNSLEGIDGWYSENYGGYNNRDISIQEDGLKKPWQLHVTRKLDAIREEIDNLDLDQIERAVALTSLILALDKVDNTMGHYASYLKEWSSRSYNDLFLKVPKTFVSKTENIVINDDIFNILNDIEAGLAYYDPPYGSNNEKMPPSRVRYAAYYHIWKTICLDDKPKLFGKAKRREDSRDQESASIFEEFRRDPSTGRFIVIEAIEKLIRKTRAKHILLSYSSGGRATSNELKQIINEYGNLLHVERINYKENVMKGMRWTNEWVDNDDKPHQEYLFLIEKN